MRVLVTGGTGMIGKALVKSLLRDGHQVLVLTRSPLKAHLPAGAEAIGWDGRTATGWGERLSQVDAVVNLVGERLSKWPWTEKQRSAFLEQPGGGRPCTGRGHPGGFTATKGAAAGLRGKLLRAA